MTPQSLALPCSQPGCPGLDCSVHRNHKPRTRATIVYGPPGSGKSTYVKQNMLWGDLVIDLDAIYAALSGLPWYEKPAGLMPFALAARDAVIDELQQGSDVRHAWLITTEPDGNKRRLLQSELNADVVFIEASPQQCMRRIIADSRRDATGWNEIINDWFHKYTAV